MIPSPRSENRGRRLRRRTASPARTRQAGLLAVLLLALSLPWELDRPLFRLGPLSVTNLELLLALALILAGLSALPARRLPRLDRAWLWLAAFGGTLLLAALLAPAHRTNALKASLRLLAGVALALALPQLVRQRREAWTLAGALVAGGLLAGLLGLAEVGMNLSPAWLTLFRVQATVVGPFLRLTGPFDYANQAAMFLEATLPLLLALGWKAIHRRRTGGRALLGMLWGGATLLYLTALLLTFSRAALASTLLVALGMGAFLWGRPGRDSQGMARLWLGMAGATLALLLLLAGTNPGFRLRLRTADDRTWYRAQIVAPQALELSGDQPVSLPITVTNQSVFTWQSRGPVPVSLGARWEDPATGQPLQEVRWPFPEPVPPQEQAQMTVTLSGRGLAPGRYRLIWDVVQEGVTWFGEKGSRPAVTEVTMGGTGQPKAGEKGRSSVAPREQRRPLAIPPRRVLWGIGVRILAEHPWLGLGMDNFRLVYGRALGASEWNRTIHTNNWALEMLVSLGLLGSLPFFVWLALLCLDLVRTVRAPQVSALELALAGGLATFLLHGLLDFFLIFNATGLLFWLLVGLWQATKQGRMTGQTMPQTDRGRAP